MPSLTKSYARNVFAAWMNVPQRLSTRSLTKKPQYRGRKALLQLQENPRPRLRPSRKEIKSSAPFLWERVSSEASLPLFNISAEIIRLSPAEEQERAEKDREEAAVFKNAAAEAEKNRLLFQLPRSPQQTSLDNSSGFGHIKISSHMA